MLTWLSDVRASLEALIHHHLSDNTLERKISSPYFIFWKSARCFHSSRRCTTAGHEAEMSPVEHCCEEDANEQLLTGACLIKVGGLELWGPNLCLNCASSLWPWELLCRAECYLFGHLIHTHKWPLGAVFDKQTDWIACVNVCGFSPSLSSRPLRMCPISLKDVENSACMLTQLMRSYVVYTFNVNTHMHTNCC